MLSRSVIDVPLPRNQPRIEPCRLPNMVREVQSKIVLHWNYRGFAELPEELRAEGENVKEVYLKWNNLYKLPQWLGVLKSLTNLYLYGNRLYSLPREIEELESLTYLDVSANELHSLPDSLCKLRSLTNLVATNNKLQTLPNGMDQLSSLQTLQLAGNSLQMLPESVCQCRKLEDICLDQNALLSLPPQIVYLPKLRSLSVTGNHLLYLPALPFSSDVQLNFDENPCLNYLTFTLGCQISSRNGGEAGYWYLKSFGCFLRSLGDEMVLPNTVLHVPSSLHWPTKPMQLVMPHGLRCVCRLGSEQVPSLYELALRTTYSLLYCHELCKQEHTYTTVQTQRLECFSLPHYIQVQLSRGPVSVCFHPHCQAPIFTHAVVWVVPVINIKNRSQEFSDVLATVYFCSQHCSKSYKRYELTNLNENEICLSRSQTEWQGVNKFV